jgi:hypothetical protein
MQGKIQIPIHRALWPPVPEPPSLYTPATIPTLTPFVDTMLSEQHEQSRKQPHRLLFPLGWRYWFFVSELVG